MMNSEKKSKKKKEKEGYHKGVETMFRIVAANHQRLSEMADNKAHIMITVNSIILTVIIGVLLRRIEEYIHLTLPSLLLIAVNLATLIFSVLATRPSIRSIGNVDETSKEKHINLMFFGGFGKLSMTQYITGMFNVMNDPKYLYRSLIMDIYYQGTGLTRKYKLLRVSYNIFMYGLVAAVCSFIIASISA